MMLQIAGITFRVAIAEEACPKTDYFQKACAAYSVSESLPFDFHLSLEAFNGGVSTGKALFVSETISYREHNGACIFFSDSSSCRISWPDKSAVLSFAPQVDRYDALFMDYIKLILSIIALKRGGLPLHASAVYNEGKIGFLFFCHSGGGKTTIARLCTPEWKVLSDEFNVIIPEQGGYSIYSTPFTAPQNFGLGSKGSAPACKLFSLSKSSVNSVADIPLREKMLSLGRSIYTIAATESIGNMTLKNMEAVCRRVPIQRLFFVNNKSIAKDLGNL